MTKTTYAVQWHDGDKWRTTHGFHGNTLTEGLSELETHKAYYPKNTKAPKDTKNSKAPKDTKNSKYPKNPKVPKYSMY